MKFNENTKISDIIQKNKSSIDAIANIAPPLKRLKNPILRKVMASRVTVREAAKMGGCTVEDFIRVLQPLGYTYTPEREGSTSGSEEKIPDWLRDAASDDIHTFDVRPIIDKGSDPLKAILAEFKKVDPGKILCIINTFVPTPLIHLLEKKQAETSFTRTVSEEEIHTFFLKKKPKKRIAEKADAEKESNVHMDGEEEFAEIYERFGEKKSKEIDVRHLEMPMPMQTILEELRHLPAGHALYVNHKRVPVFLLEELAGDQFEIHIRNIEEGNVKMIIFHREI